jgi:glutaredoxin
MRFSWPQAVLAIAAGIACAALWHGGPRRGAGEGTAPALPYSDTKGGTHSLAQPAKPAVVVLWVTPCSYCTRAMNVLDRLRALYPEEDLDVVGFYLNAAEDADVERMAAAERHRFTMARGQPTGPYVEVLTKGFNFRGTGRDIYVVGKDGRYVAVDSSDLSTPDYAILQKLRVLLINSHGLKERG